MTAHPAPESPGLTGPHWAFVLALYAQPGVADACLVLQAELGVDVVVLLFALYAAKERGLVFGDEELRAANAVVDAWRREVILPLRAVRRRMKEAPSPGLAAEKEALRARVKALEIEAEQVALALLAAHFEDAGMESGRPGRGAAARSGLVAWIAASFAGRAAFSGASAQAVDRLQRAVD